jgi:hypothetical protein
MGQQEDNLWIRKEGSEVETVSSGLKFEGGTDLSTEAPMDTGRPDLARAKQPERCKARHASLLLPPYGCTRSGWHSDEPAFNRYRVSHERCTCAPLPHVQCSARESAFCQQNRTSDLCPSRGCLTRTIVIVTRHPS